MKCQVSTSCWAVFFPQKFWKLHCCTHFLIVAKATRTEGVFITINHCVCLLPHFRRPTSFTATYRLQFIITNFMTIATRNQCRWFLHMSIQIVSAWGFSTLDLDDCCDSPETPNSLYESLLDLPETPIRKTACSQDGQKGKMSLRTQFWLFDRNPTMKTSLPMPRASP